MKEKNVITEIERVSETSNKARLAAYQIGIANIKKTEKNSKEK